LEDRLPGKLVIFMEGIVNKALPVTCSSLAIDLGPAAWALWKMSATLVMAGYLNVAFGQGGRWGNLSIQGLHFRQHQRHFTFEHSLLETQKQIPTRKTK